MRYSRVQSYVPGHVIDKKRGFDLPYNPQIESGHDGSDDPFEDEENPAEQKVQEQRQAPTLSHMLKKEQALAPIVWLKIYEDKNGIEMRLPTKIYNLREHSQQPALELLCTQ